MPLCASVVIDGIVNRIDKQYDYLVPDSLAGRLAPGMRVIVPFSRSNTRKKALVLAVAEKEDDSKRKEIIEAFDDEPLIDRRQLLLVDLLKRRYFVTYYNAFKTIVPRGIDFKINQSYQCEQPERLSDPSLAALFQNKNRRVKADAVPAALKKSFASALASGLIEEYIDAKSAVGRRQEKWIVRKYDADEIERYVALIEKRYEKQRDLLSVMLDYSEISLRDALYYSGCSMSTVQTLVRKGMIEIKTVMLERDPYQNIEKAVDTSPIRLSPEQQTVYDDIAKSTDKFKTHLIQGVTGSGKTVVYTALIDRVLESGKSVIFMVPEISLTPQMLARFYGRYGDAVAVVHSGLAPGERADEWRKIKRSDRCVVVGTRSAVFAPVHNLGMVIIDEEHEQSYKSESSPRFHAKDIASYLCRDAAAPLVLGSATPSVESCYYAKRGKYRFHRIDSRFNQKTLPSVEIIDMRNAYKQGNQSFLSEELTAAIGDTLAAGEQSILLLNRRGAYTMVGCRSCGFVAKCPHCGVALTYHTANGRCMCHYCGYSTKMFDICPKCAGKHIKKLGVGTQLAAKELAELFPNAKILRMDYDTVGSYVSYGSKLNAFRNGDYDIMLGTQMVAKGLDFPNVTLVGVINADQSLFVDDFRSNERTFALLTQVCGRSGRANKEGKAMIQTYSPDHDVIRYAKSQNYDQYFDFEISFRKAMNYPPFCDLIQFVVSNYKEADAYRDVSLLYATLDRQSKAEFSDIPVRMLSPTAPRIARMNEKYRFSLLIKSRVCGRLYEMLGGVSELFESLPSDVSINVNPMNTI